MRLANKTALITGGGTGIGFACAKLFVDHGANVIIFGRRQEKLVEAAEKISSNLVTVQGDIRKKKDIDRLMKKTLEINGRIDILVNNAGTFSMSPVHEMEEEAWDAVLDINLRGVFLLTRQVLGQMVKQQSGSIIHISSILGLVGTPGAAAYNTSKGALNQFSRSIAVEYGKDGIRSNAICPGMIETEMTATLRENKELMAEWIKDYPIGRFGVPEDVAQACLYLAGDESSFVTGTVIPVDGGYTAL